MNGNRSSKAEARSYLVFPEGEEKPPLPAARYSDDGPDDPDWDGLGSELSAKLLSFLASHTIDERVDGGAFEAEASPLVHTVLPCHPALADAEFWIWLAVTHCEELVSRRYSGKLDPRNFGIGGTGENLLRRLWLRAEIAFEPSQPDNYALARFGDIDFWRSHVFRQGYGDVRSFSRAFLEFQFPKEKGRKPRLKIVQIRALAKQLKRARSNLMFEVMTEERAAQFIQSEWERLAQSDV